MKRRIQETFDMIHADEELKEKTKKFLAEKTGDYIKSYKRTRIPSYTRLAPVMCLLFLLIGFGGYRIYFTPVSFISIDINPSLELDVNRFDKVIAVKEYNEDGERLAESLEVMFMNYEDALEQIMENASVQTYLAQDELMSIVVSGDDEEKTQAVYNNVEACTAGHQNTHCYHADSSEMESAQETGLSYGKYLAYLELQALDPDITPEDVQGMTMREIRNWIDALAGDEDQSGQEGGNGQGAGNGSCQGSGTGTGQGSGSGTGQGSGTGSGSGQGTGTSGGHHGSGHGNGSGSGQHHQE